VDREPRSRVREEKRALQRLIRLAESNSEWVLGYEDETWWSRFEQPSLHSWAETAEPMHLLQKEAKKDDPDPKALSCYGLYLPELGRRSTWLRFVDGRPVSAITTQFLSWSCQKLEELGKKALVLVWDNASWHKSKFVKEWIAAHNREVRERRGAHSALLSSQEEPLAQRNRADVGPPQAQGGRARFGARGLRACR
jgi:hypothetical protein